MPRQSVRSSLISSFHSALAGLGFASLAVVSGCGDDRPDLYPISGRVTVDGTPARGAYVTLHPEKRQPLGTPKPFGRADAAGQFELTTYSTADGVPAGDYRVTVVWPENPDARGPSPDRLSGHYANPSGTSLSVTIQEGMTELAPFRLEGS